MIWCVKYEEGGNYEEYKYLFCCVDVVEVVGVDSDCFIVYLS